MTLEQSIHAMRLRVLHEAQATRNVSATCRRFGLSRTVFYRWRQRWLRYGRTACGRSRSGAAGARRTCAAGRATVLALAVAWPTWGPQRLSTQLARDGGGRADDRLAGVHRHGLGIARPARGAGGHSAATAGLLTERTRRACRRSTPHVPRPSRASWCA